MADEYNSSGRKWSLEEIDELLQDSGVLPKGGEDVESELDSLSLKKAEAVDPRPVHNDEIDHKIISPNMERSEAKSKTRVFGALESDKYRERFLNKPIQNLEKTAEHTPVSEEDMPYERSGFVKRDGSFQNTRGLEPMPVLVADELISDYEKAARDDAKTKTIGLRSLAVTDGNAIDTEIPEDDSQLRFEGFDINDKVEKVNEEDVERELIKKRNLKAGEFVLTKDITGDNDDKSFKFGTDEYRSAGDKFKVSFFLKKSKSAALTASIVCSVAFIILLAISVVAKSGTASDDGAKMIFSVVNIILIAVACIAAHSVIIDGLRSFKGLKFNRNTGSVIAVGAVLIQCVAEAVFELPEGGVFFYSAAAVIPLVLSSIASYSEAKRIIANFDYVSSNDLWSIGNIQKKETAFEIGRGLLLDEPLVLSSQKTQFPGRFLELSKKYYPSDDINKKIIPICTGVSLLIGAVTALVSKSGVSGISAFSAAVCVSVPYFAFLADNIVIGKESKKLLSKGAMVSGWEAYRDLSASNAIALDSSEVFDENGGNIFGIKTFYSMRVDEAILDTAALLVQSGGPLGNLFKRVILGKTELLPPVDTLAYEDKLGLSAWIQNRRVLVGSSDLLRNHNVEVPEKQFIDKYLHDGRYPLFLAIEGKLAAMFIVSYDINEDRAKFVRSIERNSVSLLLGTDDANVTDDMAAESLSIPKSGIKVLSAVSADILKTYRKGVTTSANSALMHDGKASSFLLAVNSALKLGSMKHISSIIQIVASAIGICFVAALSFVSGLSQLSCMQLVLTEAVFTAICAAVVSIKR